MNLQESLLPFFQAGFAGVWVISYEPEEAQREITLLAAQQKYQIMVWDHDKGVYWPHLDKPNDPKSVDPLVPLRTAASKQLLTSEEPVPLIVLLHNFHRFFTNPMVVQAMVNAILRGKKQAVFFVVLAPLFQVPLELEKLFRVVEHRLPGPEQINNIAAQMLQEEEHSCEPRVLQAASGLIRREIEDAFALSLVQHARLDPDTIWSIKTQAIAKKGFMQLHEGKQTFADIGGMEGLKQFAQKLLRPGVPQPANGVLLLGPSGTGKSVWCKALGKETDRRVLIFDMGRIQHKHVGVSQENLREFFSIAEALSPVIVFMDEVEKAYAGSSSGENDAGVKAELMGQTLSWLQDKNEKPGVDVFVVATSNNMEALPPEFSRAERWDGVWFIDLPSHNDLNLIWKIYLKQYEIYGVKAETQDILYDGWTGAEIKSCCRLSAMLDEPLIQAAERIVPVSVSSRDRVEKLREWARHRCLDASTGKVYVGSAEVGANGQAPRRRLQTPILKENA